MNSTNYEITFNVRSKEATQVGSLNTDIIVNLPSSIVIPENYWCEMSVVAAEIPLSFYNISAALQNNKFEYYTNLSIFLNTITIPSGNYTVDTLMVIINAAQSHFVMTYNDTFNKFYLTLNVAISDLIMLYDITNYWNQIFGVFNNQLIIYPGDYLNGVCNLASVHSLQIRTDLNTGSTISTSNPNSSVCQKIPLLTNATGIIIHNKTNYIQKSYIKYGSIKSFNLQITEQNNKLIDLNGCVYELSFLFKIIKVESHISEEQKISRSERLKSQPIQQIETQPIQQIETQPIQQIETQPIQPIDENQPITLTDIANELLS